jgi:cGAMP-activated phospholipase
MSGAPPAPSRFQILSLSGGGIRGLFTARVLERLEERFARPLHEAFDLFAGTSVGGIIALGLAAGRPARELRGLIEDRGPEIFRRRTSGWLRPKYGSEGLRAAIEDVLGAEAVMGDLRRPAIVPAVALTTGRAQVFRTPHHPAHLGMRRLGLVEVALATAAAPTYFPIARVGDGDYVDGGLIANAPDLVALHEAEAFFRVPRRDIVVLAVGTSFASAAVMACQPAQRGVIGWMWGKRFLEITLAAQQALAQQLCRDALGERYLLLDHPQAPRHARGLGLDGVGPEALATLRQMAEGTVEDARADPRLGLIGGHTGRPLDAWRT